MKKLKKDNKKVTKKKQTQKLKRYTVKILKTKKDQCQSFELFFFNRFKKSHTHDKRENKTQREKKRVKCAN